MTFNIIKDQDFDIINSILSTISYNGSEYSKIYLKAWKFFSSHQIEFAYDENIAFIRFMPCEKYFDCKLEHKYFYLAPIAKPEDILKGFLKIEEQCKLDCDLLKIVSVPDEIVALIEPLNYKIETDVNYSEYLYSPKDLIELNGKKYHSKRNHIKNFDKKYSYTFRAYEKGDEKAVMDLFYSWEETKKFYENSEIALEEADEYYALKTELDMVLHEENAFADVLIVDGRLIGFTLGEITASNLGIVHVEKCDINFDGVYSKINNLFAKKHFQNVRIINRQEDIGIEGLRKSKMSYHPIAFCKKNMITK